MKESFTPEEVTQIEDKAYEVGLRIGKHEERELIIVLLDKYRESIVLQSAMSAGGHHALSDAIALIKGENE